MERKYSVVISNKEPCVNESVSTVDISLFVIPDAIPFCPSSTAWSYFNSFEILSRLKESSMLYKGHKAKAENRYMAFLTNSDCEKIVGTE